MKKKKCAHWSATGAYNNGGSKVVSPAPLKHKEYTFFPPSLAQFSFFLNNGSSKQLSGNIGSWQVVA